MGRFLLGIVVVAAVGCESIPEHESGIRYPEFRVWSDDPDMPSRVVFEDAELGGESFGGVWIGNVGDELLDLHRVVFEPADVLQPVDRDAIPQEFAPGEQHLMLVRFAPHRDEDVQGTVRVTSSDAAVPEVSIALVGSGLGPREVVSPLELGFETLLFCEEERVVEIRNDGRTDLVVESLEVDGPAFAWSLPPLPLAIASGEALAVPVSFRPAVENDFEGSLRVQTNDPSIPWTTVEVEGVGEPRVRSERHRQPDDAPLSSFQLDFPADPTSVEVWVDFELVPSGWTLVGDDVVEFETPPSPGASIRFDYVASGPC